MTKIKEAATTPLTLANRRIDQLQAAMDKLRHLAKRLAVSEEDHQEITEIEKSLLNPHSMQHGDFQCGDEQILSPLYDK